VQAPATHADPAQAADAPHWPELLQVWIPLLEHCLAPGVQTPVQAPVVQA
jgi:hypothetical protein